MTSEAMVWVVDDDFRVREALTALLASAGFRVEAFGTAAAYVAAARPDVPACLVLDVGLPDINGLDLQIQLAGSTHPRIVFITGQGDIPSSVRACKAGAIDFLTKPFSDVKLLGAVREAIEQDRADRSARAERQGLEQRLALLTPREREVLPLVVSGLLNKQAASVLGISEITLQIHRSKIMRKLAADSLPELVRMTETLGIAATHSRRARL
jgi:FixJ family two-component response regulator